MEIAIKAISPQAIAPALFVFSLPINLYLSFDSITGLLLFNEVDGWFYGIILILQTLIDSCSNHFERSLKHF
jgi:hypothetical protein